MDFSNVHKYEKCAEVEYSGNKYMVSVGVNPINEDVLFSLYIDRKLVIENRVCLSGEFLLNGFGDESFMDELKCDFAFLYARDDMTDGMKVPYSELGKQVFLYLIPKVGLL